MIQHCMVCSKEYETYEVNQGGNIKGGTRKMKLKRGRNTINCSRKCSQIYSSMQKEERLMLKKIHDTRYKGGKRKCQNKKH